MRLVYIVLTYLFVPIAFAGVLWRGLRDRNYWRGIPLRFGFGAHIGGTGAIWIHAVSLGEVTAAAPLLRALRGKYPARPLVLTTATPTGMQRARELFRDGVDIRYLPYDLPGAVRRFLERVRPQLAVILETELWPNLLHGCGRAAVPVVVASARLSPRSVGRYRRMASLFREVLARDAVIAAQSPADAERFIAIGAAAQNTHVIGNIKFDFAVDASVADHGAQLRARIAPARAVWVAGSTHEGEEAIVLDAHLAICAVKPNALLVLVPRHPNRFDAVAALLERRGIFYARRSRGKPQNANYQVLLVDTIGELLQFYAAADVAFVGGSLVPIGGHNLLEPAALGVPIVTGPYNENGIDIARKLADAGALQQVPDAAGLGATVIHLLGDRSKSATMVEAARRVIAENTGAVARLCALIEPMIGAAPVLKRNPP
jgi:3-deoxy-D-manno-octulosonic-acid transferase